MASQSNTNILIGCTGSVAAIYTPKLAEAFISLGHSVIIVPTQNSFHFLKSEAVSNCRTVDPKYYKKNCSHCTAFDSFHKDNVSVNDIHACIECETRSLYPELRFVSDSEEWEWQRRGDPVKHIELRNWADMLILAPLDANTLAKIAQGLCDNLLTCIVRAWDMKKTVIFCLAMNTQMYLHPFTSQHRNILKSLGFKEVEVTTKTLVCGENGAGAMANIDVIVEKVKMFLSKEST